MTLRNYKAPSITLEGAIGIKLMKNIDNKFDNIKDIKCAPCDNAIAIAAAQKVCIISDKLATNKTCHILHESVVMGSIDLGKYLKSVQRICTEKPAKDAIQSLFNNIDK